MSLIEGSGIVQEQALLILLFKYNPFISICIP